MKIKVVEPFLKSDIKQKENSEQGSHDDLVSYKHKKAVIPFEERIEIVSSIKYVDEVVSQENMNKLDAWQKLQFNVMFVGSDWKNTDKWNNYEKEFDKVDVKIIYFPYTKGTSSTILNETLKKIRNK